jgi:cobalt-zinc-cadmium efflux system membrane fusion protein
VGDKVQKGRLLAVVWCKDLGEKKSELVDALSQLRLDRKQLEKLEQGYRRQAIPEASVRQARRNVESALNAVARAERTLRVWRLSDAEVEDVKAEAERIIQRHGKRDKEKEKQWARVEIRAPFDGTVLERNLATGDIVDTTADLFKIADVSRLSVWAHVYENHLPALLKLPQPIPWTVRLKSDPEAPALSGRIEMIGSLVDPTQHTVLVRGSVGNPGGRYRAGQFITATVQLPAPEGETVIPIGALVEDGQQSIVFVQPRLGEPIYSLRRVKVVRRSQDHAYLAARLRTEEKNQGLQALALGERVVTAWAIGLKASLEDLKLLAKKTTDSLHVQR